MISPAIPDMEHIENPWRANLAWCSGWNQSWHSGSCVHLGLRSTKEQTNKETHVHTAHTHRIANHFTCTWICQHDIVANLNDPGPTYCNSSGWFEFTPAISKNRKNMICDWLESKIEGLGTARIPESPLFPVHFRWSPQGGPEAMKSHESPVSHLSCSV